MSNTTSRPRRFSNRSVSFRFVLVALACCASFTAAHAQIQPHGGMMRYPDVSATSIVFVYADDLWIVPREGGVASPLASPPGSEALPRFSADGQTIAFVGNYDGNRDIYTIGIAGGIPTRVTHHPAAEILSDWTPDGKLMFFMNGLAGRDRIVELFTVSPQGGMPEKMPVPYGAFGAISPSGEWLAYTPHTADNRTWKRYRGGMATDIWLFNLKNKSSKRVTTWEGTDTQPMWQRDQLYYLSDDGPSHKLNIWCYDPSSEKRRQVTRFDDHDVKWPAIGPGPRGPQGDGEIVFQHGTELMLLDLKTERAQPVHVTIPGARPTLRARAIDAAKTIQSWDLSPNGKRALAGAHGDVWSLPAKNGSPRNLTHTSGVAEREPAWSPDGKWIAYLADATGEYELYLLAADGRGEPKQLTKDGHAFRAHPTWSPDSKYVAFCDKTGSVFIQAVAGGAPTLVDKDPQAGDLLSPMPSWSHDSRWLAYSRAEELGTSYAIWLYEVENGGKHRVTSGMFADTMPTFDRKGDYLYFKSTRAFKPLYGEIDQDFLYANTEVLLAVPLRADMKSPLAPKSDEQMDKKDIADKKDDAGKEHSTREASASRSSDALASAQDKDASKDAKGDKKDDKDDKGEKGESKPRERVEIALDGFERRAIVVPIKSGVFAGLSTNDKGALVYVRASIRGSEEDALIQTINITDDKPEEKTVVADADNFTMSADGKKLLIVKNGKPMISDAAPDAKPEEVPTGGMTSEIDPREEWKELVLDAWRLERDFFYDPNMHHVNWNKVRDEYMAMLADCTSREDVGYVIREMISELNVGHAYYSGGADSGEEQKVGVGLLGCDFDLKDGAYRIARIQEGAPWDVDGRGPLSQPGVDVHVGDYLLAVNGVRVDVRRDPWAAFQGLAGKTITISVSTKPKLDETARDVVVGTLDSEREVRYRAWIEQHRSYVDQKTNGKVGYVYVPSTGVDGQNDLVRQMIGQMGKSALIIDERWNSGGQIPTRFIELLNRPITNYWARRDAKDQPWPPDAHQGPKCMLINGLSGSGGDAFPTYFKMAGLGKLIGTRTWGGLVGLSGNPGLIDGAAVTVPTFAYFKKDGTWGVEGHGADPDIEVIDDPALMTDGRDPQIDAAVKLMLEEIEKHPYTPPARPAYPDRSGMGVPERDR
jgi:tricorn protease